MLRLLTNLTVKVNQLLQLQPLGVHGRMHVAVQGDPDIGVP